MLSGIDAVGMFDILGRMKYNTHGSQAGQVAQGRQNALVANISRRGQAADPLNDGLDEREEERQGVNCQLNGLYS